MKLVKITFEYKVNEHCLSYRCLANQEVLDKYRNSEIDLIEAAVQNQKAFIDSPLTLLKHSPSENPFEVAVLTFEDERLPEGCFIEITCFYAEDAVENALYVKKHGLREVIFEGAKSMGEEEVRKPYSLMLEGAECTVSPSLDYLKEHSFLLN